MKKYILSGLLALMATLWLTSCVKDYGNYNYKEINELVFTGIDSAHGYSVLFGENLKINPGIVRSLDKNPDPANYTYKWSTNLTIRRTENGLVYTDYPEVVFSTEENLDARIGVPTGNYTLVYRVTDKTTGITYTKKAPLVVSSPVYEGFMVLNDVSDTGRLDFVTYSPSTNSFLQHTNIQAELGVNAPPPAKPHQIFLVTSRFNSSALLLLDANGIQLLNSETFNYDPAVTLATSGMGTLPATFKPTSGFYPWTRFFNNAWLIDDNGDAYASKPTSGIFFNNIATNYSSEDQHRFSMSPYIIADEYNQMPVVFDKTNRRFLTQPYSSYASTPLDPVINMPTGKDLIYMTCNYGGFYDGTFVGYAVLKEPTQDKYYMMTIKYRENGETGEIYPEQDYFQELTGTDFNLAENYAVSPDLGYLFYNVGGKLYEYDMGLRTSKLMMDLGSQNISFLGFEHRILQEDMRKWLIVGSYDPAGEQGNNGTLGLYAVPPVNGALVEKQKWTGLGKVVSVFYRERRPH